jgi:hypothetical protein
MEKVRSTEDLIKGAWEFYKNQLNNFIIAGLIILAISFVLVIPTYIIGIFLFPWIISWIANSGSIIAIIGLVSIIILILLLFIAFASYMDIVFILIARDASQGAKNSLSVYFREALAKFWPYFWINIIISIIVFIGFIFFIIPGIILGWFLFFVKYLIIVDDVRGLKTLKISMRMVSHYFKEVFLLILIYMAASFVAGGFGGGIITMFLITPMMICSSLLLYLDIKM